MVRQVGLIAVVAFVLAGGYFGWRQAALQHELDELAKQLGDASAASAPDPNATGEAARAAKSLSDRVVALEAEVRSLRGDLRSLEKATGDASGKAAGGGMVSDQQILNVMRQQGSKVVESQLKYHRERWLDQREAALADFTRRFQLTQRQSDELWGLLSDEIDRMVEIMRKPDSFENPERAAAEWKQVLLDTDAAAHRVLDPQKSAAWDQGRFLERKLLWPWLPD